MTTEAFGSDVAVRVAVPDDHAAVHALLVTSAEDLRDTPSSRYLRAAVGVPLSDPEATTHLLENDRWTVVVGTYDHVDCGVTLAQRTATGEGGGDVVTVSWIHVEPEFRRCGVAEAMLSYLTAEMAAQGGATLDVLAAPGDRATKSLLEASGLKARVIVMSRGIPGIVPGDPEGG